MISKTIKICPNQHTDLLKFLFTGFFENKKRPGTSFQAMLSMYFFGKSFSFVMLHEIAKFHHQTEFTFQVI